MLTVVAWKYAPPAVSGRQRTVFHSSHVNVLRRMLARHCHVPHRLVCITDDTNGLDSRVEAIPLPSFPHIEPRDGRYPMCLRRLWLFSDDAVRLGNRIMSIDLDVVILRDMARIVERTEDFVGWSIAGRRFYQGGIYLLTPGTRTHVWTSFDPETSPELIERSQYVGSDQAWMKLTMRDDEAVFDDGLIVHERSFEGDPPASASVVQFSGAGQQSPWHSRNIVRPWVARNWR